MTFRVRDFLACAVPALLLFFPAAAVQAQTLEDVSVIGQGAETIVRLAFTGAVRLAQQSPTGASQIFQIRIEPLGAEDVAPSTVTDEGRQLAASGAQPQLSMTLAPAPAQRGRVLTLQLKETATVRARPGPNARSLDLVFSDRVGAAAPAVPVAAASAPLDTAAAPAVAAAASAPPGDVAAAAAAVDDDPNAPARLSVAQLAAIEVQAAELLAKAKTQMGAGSYEPAIGTLSQILQLPPTPSMQEAQELIGLAWEGLGDGARARTEYALYLKLFKTGDGVQRVRRRLADLGGAVPAEESAKAAADARADAVQVKQPPSRLSGNVAPYYLGGKARSQSLVNLSSGIDQATLTKTTESAIVTSLDLGGRYNNDTSEVKGVIRGTGSVNLSSASKNTSVLNAAYVDYRHLGSGLAARVGRQSAINGGLLGMFDGVSLTAPMPRGTRIDLMAGVPANVLVSVPDERLFAGMIEADNIGEHWGGDAYLTDQTTQGYDNRRAIGAEVRYADERGSLYGLFDYDALFHIVNAISVQGSVQVPGQTTITLLLDTRKAPSLELTNALISTGLHSIKELLQTKTLSEIRTDARTSTADARQVLLSVARPLSEKWQGSADIRYSQVGALPAVGNFDATPATGAQYGMTFQVTGTDIYSKRDINNFNLSLLSTPFFHGLQLAYNNLTGLRNNTVTAEPSFRMYSQRDKDGGTLLRLSPGMRGTYQISKRASISGEGMLEHSTSKAPTSHDTTNSIYFYVGYRYDLF